MISSAAGMSFAVMSARAGWRGGSSNAAVTCPCSAPWRTRAASPRAPSASAKASSRMDLPAPVSPVSTDRPEAKSISSRSMRTMSRMESRASMTTVLVFRLDTDAGGLPDALPRAAGGHAHANRGDEFPPRRSLGLSETTRCRRRRWVEPACGVKPGRCGRSEFRADLELARGQLGERLADPMALVLIGLDAPLLHEGIGVFIPTAVRKIMTQHGGRGLRFLDYAERHVGFGQPKQRFLDVTRGLVACHHDLEAIDRTDEVPGIQILTADIHLLAGQLVARDLDLALGRDGILGIGVFADHLVERLHCLLGAILVAR